MRLTYAGVSGVTDDDLDPGSKKGRGGTEKNVNLLISRGKGSTGDGPSTVMIQTILGSPDKKPETQGCGGVFAGAGGRVPSAASKDRLEKEFDGFGWDNGQLERARWKGRDGLKSTRP
ncbi:hypothetical protein KFL_001930010 [Klebsormidium nitens]|uniref:Uncharacterized protein n=1 Tax=Klebsormidium nitens TaxID=105231 RepID=A0A1Y1I3J3_KLENI|nr:hypothetical protein KFL_001930010 [Klebsormidium nitens]|eukprot:GAQ84522.1 hypothetical protein KFL_001930010 [Klebsormidium nitens]